MKSPLPACAAIAALLTGVAPARAEERSAAAEAATEAPATPTCADRPRLEAERDALRSQITGIAMAGSDRRQKRRGAQAGKMAARAVVGLFIPFGVGLAVSGTVALAEAADKSAKAKRPKPEPAPEPDVAAMIARQQVVETQLAALARACAASGPGAQSGTE
jgi:hypothetical protein